jgi:single-strand DNA-binding protein
MASLNQLTFIGNATRDPEVKQLNGGTTVCEIGMAINDRYKSGNEWKEEVCFIDISFFGRTAEIAGEYLAKGEAFCITGKLKLDQWEDKQTGQKRSKHRVVADKLVLLGRGSPPDEASQQEPAKRQPKAKQERQPAPVGPPPSDDVPFAWVGLLLSLAIGGASWLA